MNVEENKLKVHDKINIEITGLGSSGEGVGKVEGFTFFVPGAITGEKVLIRVEQLKKTYGVGKVVEVLEKSPHRVTPICPIYADCGGCQLQHISYEYELEEKRKHVEDALVRIGHLKDVEVLPVIGSEDCWHYRNKMQFPVANKKGDVRIGCYAKGTHRVINVEDCAIQKEKNNQIITIVKKWMEEYNISAYDENEQRGMIRHVMGRVGVHTGELMVGIITSTEKVPKLKELAKMLKEALPGLKSVVQNINRRHNNVIMGSETKLIYGKEMIRDKIGVLKFNISAQSFFQVNSEQAEKLYNVALEYANLSGEEFVADVYCGTGTITLFLAKKAKHVYGIEIVPDAIKDAKENAKNNRVENVSFILGDASKELQKLVDEWVKPDVIVLDPPRSGCEGKVLDAIISVKPEKVVYVSCNPATLARDLAYLVENGFKVEKVQPVDMFSRTSHVESVALITRTNGTK